MKTNLDATAFAKEIMKQHRDAPAPIAGVVDKEADLERRIANGITSVISEIEATITDPGIVERFTKVRDMVAAKVKAIQEELAFGDVTSLAEIAKRSELRMLKEMLDVCDGK